MMCSLEQAVASDILAEMDEAVLNEDVVDLTLDIFEAKNDKNEEVY